MENPKVALCFIIRHSIHKETIWREWIEPNKDIINIYIHCKDLTPSPSLSSWIGKYTIPRQYIAKTSYFHIVPAYMNLIQFALTHDTNNQWFCFLTDSCVPLLSPSSFRDMFLQMKERSIFKWKPIWWNTYFNKRANLRLLHPEFHLANDPYFVLKREDAKQCVKYSIVNRSIYQKICQGIIANESVFAIILKVVGSLDEVINESTHLTDWEHMSSSTSPYVFKNGLSREMDYVVQNKGTYSLFLRKVDPAFPDNLLRKLIWMNPGLGLSP